MNADGVEVTVRHLYLDLLKRCLVNLIYRDPPLAMPGQDGDRFDLAARLSGRDCPSQAHTMIGMRRLDNIQGLLQDVLHRGVPGDLIEAGVARGGAAIFMRGVLRAFGVEDRAVWVADSFEGLPTSPEEGLTDRSLRSPELRQTVAAFRGQAATAAEMTARYGMSYEDVRQNFARYGLLDDRVCFLRGWFRATLPAAPIDRLALLRIDADLYDSTYDVLRWLYPNLSAGGYVIVDDYYGIDECRAAVDDYLRDAAVEVELARVDQSAACWRKAQ